MDRTLEIWPVVISLALLASIFLQIFLMPIFIQMSPFLRPKPGQRNLGEIADRAYEAVEHANRAVNVTVDMLKEFEPAVSHAVSVSRRQIMRADQVVGDAPEGVARIQHDVSIVRNWPFRETRALSVGVFAAKASFFRKNGTANEGKRW